MNADDHEIPIPEESDSSDLDDDSGIRRSRAELDAMIERLWSAAQAHRGLLEQLHERVAQIEAREDADTEHLARWLAFPAPPAAEDLECEGETPLFTIAHFVAYYNEVYVGRPGSRAVAIPDCWLDHPGLLAEIATLTYTWRAAHLGKRANPRDAQHWHDRWRPAFAERLVSEWTHPHCLTDTHKPVGAASLPDRYTLES
ncbi:hypothetical protein [Amycolatopsis sp. DSM 110486]|uniref:hypothetical protein n=1 Tax=Amycolatopsis sp. DSM 110486 TaxID=2865832 RepID=UPI001C6A35A0|nr:hypothetical protein [Amycolatopsis sp. DSM 110486]QYN18920.1 hypothetical protein K1T34_40525 [Amycolatopsis sp. DSM 110486]